MKVVGLFVFSFVLISFWACKLKVVESELVAEVVSPLYVCTINCYTTKKNELRHSFAVSYRVRNGDDSGVSAVLVSSSVELRPING